MIHDLENCDSPHIRMFRGRLKLLNSVENFLTDSMEARSSSNVSILAAGISFTISSLALLPADKFLTPMTTWTPRSARTRAVSFPIPLEAPAACARWIKVHRSPQFLRLNEDPSGRFGRNSRSRKICDREGQQEPVNSKREEWGSGSRRRRTCYDGGQPGAVESFGYLFGSGRGGEARGPLPTVPPPHSSLHSLFTTRTRGRGGGFLFSNSLLRSSRWSDGVGGNSALSSPARSSLVCSPKPSSKLRRRTDDRQIWISACSRRL